MVTSTLGAQTAYCHDCADTFGLLSHIQPLSPVPSSYQLTRMPKHLNPTSTSSAGNTVFLRQTTEEYGLAASMAAAAGFVVVSSGYIDLVWQSTGPIGYRQHSTGELLDSAKRVLSTDRLSDHCFPVSSTEFAGAVCAICGVSLVF